MCEIVPEYKVLIQKLEKLVAHMYDADQKVILLTNDLNAERVHKAELQALLDQSREESLLLRHRLHAVDMLPRCKSFRRTP